MDFSRLPSVILTTVVLTALSTTVLATPTDANARISMKGLRALVTFSPVGDSISIQVSLGCTDCVQDNESFVWSITEYPMIYDRIDPCSSENIGSTFTAGGGSLNDIHGILEGATLNAGPVTLTDPNLSFNGNYSIFGRALLLERTSDSERFCASIVPESDIRTAVATLSSTVSGTITFRQVLSSGSADEIVTGIYVELDVTGSPQMASTFSWEIRDNTDVTPGMTLEEQCGATQENARYDLTATHGSLVVGTVSDRRRYYFIDTELPLDGSNSILGASLVLSHPNGTVLTCSLIQNLRPRTVQAPVNAKNITGAITFHQRSPFDYTAINVNFSNLRSIIGGYHIHEYPIPPRYFKDDNLASGDSVGMHFNPYSITDFPSAAVGTEDQYEIGDISNKFGDLSGRDFISAEYIDWNMPLFGTNSISGRSIVLHLADDGSRYSYGQVGYHTDNLKTVVVDFLAPITGSIIMKQDEEDPLSETTVFVDIANLDGMKTEGHNWHVHVNKNGKDYMSETGRCSSNAGHYNPFDVDLVNGYSECSPENPRRCEVGDFSGKHGTLVAAEMLHLADGKFFFTDVQLPLTGAYSIDERSVVIHFPDRGDPRLACQNTFGVPSKRVSTTRWSDPAISGTVLFEQGGIHEATEIKIKLSGLGRNANGWHVHVLPVPNEADGSVCGLTLGHFNPFDIPDSPPVATLDQYEVGDLSGKFDYLRNKSVYEAEYTDETLLLRGPRSIDGRSVVVHRDDETGSRWSCASLQEMFPSMSFQMESIAAFNTQSFSGSFRFLQVHLENDYTEDTLISVDAFSPEVTSWSVLATTEITECTGDSALYNPFNILDDSSACSLARLGQCVVGNIDGKHGAPPTEGAVFTDTNLPLFGEAPILGRVLRLDVGGEVLCSRILPAEEKGAVVSLSFPSPVEFDPYDFRSEISSKVDGLEMWQVVVSEPTTSPHSTLEGCQTITFWVIGPNPGNLAEKIEEATDLGDYTPAECSECDETQSTCRASTMGPLINTSLLSFFIFLIFYYSFM